VSSLSAERWLQLRLHVDTLMAMPPEAREVTLAERFVEGDPLAAEIRDLLRDIEAANASGFLDHPAHAHEPEACVGSLAGSALGNYQLLELVGQGGMGSVWTAKRTDGMFDGHVAIKVLNAALREGAAVHRFLYEGRLLSRLSHPNIARLFDAGVHTDGTPFLVLEYVGGEAIDRYCDTHTLDLRQRLELFLAVLAAVEHSHAHLIVHRDIKPSNVIVDNDGVAKLLDFGIARLMIGEDGNTAEAAVRTETLWGRGAMTVPFAAPEQLLDKPATTQTDVYSLGVLLYLLLTGQHPTGLRRAAAAAYARPILDGQIIRPSQALLPAHGGTPGEATASAAARGTSVARLRTLLAGDLDNILLKSLKPDPHERYASVAQFSEDIRCFLQGRAISVRADSIGYRITRFGRRHRLATVAMGVAIAALIAGSASTAWQASEAADQHHRLQAVQAFVLDLFGVGDVPNRPVQASTATASELLERGANSIDVSKAYSPRTKSDLYRTVGEMYLGLGRPREALEQFEKQLRVEREIRRDSFFGSDEAVLRALMSVADAAHKTGANARWAGSLAEAEPLIQRLGRNLPDLRGRWAILRAQLEMPTNASVSREYARQAIAAYRQTTDTRGLLFALNVQTLSLAAAGDLHAAELSSDEELRMLNRYWSADDRLRADTLNNRSTILYERFRPRAAVELMRQAVASAVRAHGLDHPTTASIRRGLLITLREAGELAECTRQADVIVRSIEKSVGPTDEYILPMVLMTTASCQREYGLLAAAGDSLQRAIDLAHNGGPDKLAWYHLQLAEIRIAQGELAAAAAEVQWARNNNRNSERASMIASVEARLQLANGDKESAYRTLQPFSVGARESKEATWRSIDLDIQWAKVALTRDARLAESTIVQLETWADRRHIREEAPVYFAKVRELRGQLAVLQGNLPLARSAFAEVLSIRSAHLAPNSPALANIRAAAAALPPLQPTGS
jgi:serine/threonine protein kinase